MLVQTISGAPVPTEESVPDEIRSSPSSDVDGPRLDLGKDTIQLRPMALRRIAPKPVFVDASGRNRRRLRILVAALVTPIVAYVALLISTLVGGPTIPMALLPHPPAAAEPHSSPAQAAPRTPKAQPTHHAPAVATPVVAGLHGSRTRASATATGTAKATHKPKGKPSPSPSPSATGTPHPKPSHSHPHQQVPGGN